METLLSKEDCVESTNTCTCYNIRKVARIVTQMYDDALRPVGLRSGQIIMLMALRIKETPTIQQLAEMICVNRTSLSRNLKPLTNTNLIHVVAGEDRRTRRLSLTTEGQAKLTEAYPLWKQAQEKVVGLLGQEGVNGLLGTLNEAMANLNNSESRAA